MLDIIERYQFCSIACQQAILVLDFIKKALDADELEMLKDFVQRNLSDEDSTHLKFESGRITNKGNLAPIVQIGLALMKMTVFENDVQEDEEDSSDEEESRAEMWREFCQERLQAYEMKWTKRLEDYSEMKSKTSSSFMPKSVAENESRREGEQQEHFLDAMLKNGVAKQNLIKKRNQIVKKNNNKPEESKEQEPEPTDSKKYFNNNYWKVPEQHDLEALLKDFE